MPSTHDLEANFTEQEWTRLKRAPLVAGMAISLPTRVARSKPSRRRARR
jgi:hypothetical protein